ncbi:hypothetical protein [Streptomyces lasiicapitis]|uniref:Uncharacterized protein n=1 Tax=Streptomyces lasiicapitis TaxID=1923961 RepID=A0ABQ2MW39_9ACTN|nr:hypothetical protein [Streptomyces lasiicapitis]GGO58904.1 hypothetical protein GCM10012286_79280 [Streptomyces lasiicapitis]
MEQYLRLHPVRAPVRVSDSMNISAFIAVLATGVILVLVGHTPVAGVAAVGLMATAAYKAWNARRIN